MQSVAAIAVSTLLGFLSGLGVGGGSLLMLWLTGPLGWPQDQARAVNLLFFLPGAAIATFLRRKNIPWKKLLPAIAAGWLCAWVLPAPGTFSGGMAAKSFRGTADLYRDTGVGV